MIERGFRVVSAILLSQGGTQKIMTYTKTTGPKRAFNLQACKTRMC